MKRDPAHGVVAGVGEGVYPAAFCLTLEAAIAMKIMLKPLLLLTASLGLAGCESTRDFLGGTSGPPAGTQGFVRGFLGGVASEEPSASAAARAVLSAGGTAADAAAAAGFMLSVTLPSRAGLGGGGACVVYHPRRDAPEAVIFMPGERQGGTSTADRPAAVPMMARGLFALTTRMQGGRPFEELMAPAEQLARFGAPVSRALVADLAVVGGALMSDPGSRAVFTRPDGAPLRVGDNLTNTALAGTLTAMRTQGVGDMHQGGFARRLTELVPAAGGGDMTVAELRAALPAVGPALLRDAGGGDRIGFLPVDGGLAAAAGYAALAAGQSADQAQSRAMAVAYAARSGQGGNAEGLLAQADLPPGRFPALPASTALTVFDRQGGAVACIFTMNNLFGIGRMAPGTGMLLAAAPGLGAIQPPLAAAAVGWNPTLRAFRIAVAASGQQSAPMAVAGPLAAQMQRRLEPVFAVVENSPEPGRAQLAACPRYLPGRPQECQTVTDPRGLGVALGAVD